VFYTLYVWSSYPTAHMQGGPIARASWSDASTEKYPRAAAQELSRQDQMQFGPCLCPQEFPPYKALVVTVIEEIAVRLVPIWTSG
jgi:hypothetical protein